MGSGEFPVSIVLKALDKLTSPVRAMGKPFEALQGTVTRLNNSFQAHSLGMEKYTKGFAAAGGALEKAGLRMTLGITAPIELFRHKAIHAAAEFEESMNRVEAATGGTAVEMKAFEGVARKIGATTAFSAKSAAQGMAILAKAGVSTTDILAKMPGVANLAGAAHIELGAAADTVAEILNGYNVRSEDAAKTIDLIARSSQLTRGGIEGFGEAMAHVGPVAAAMNVKLEDTAAVVIAMSRAGIMGGRGGSALAKGIAEIIHPSEQAVRVLTKLRINPWDVMDKNRNLKSVIGLLELLQARGATAADIMQIFGTKGGVAFSAVLSKGTKGLRELEGQLKSSGGAAEKLAEIQERGLNAQFQRLSNAMEGLGIAIGKSGIIDSMAHMVEIGVGVLNWLAELNPTLLKWGFIISGVVVTIGPLLGYLGLMVTGIGALLPILSMLGAGFSLVMGTIAVMGAPILLIVAAIAAVAAGAYLVYKNWTPIKRFFVDLWDTVRFRFLDTWNFIREKLGIFRFLIPGAAGIDAINAGVNAIRGVPQGMPSNVIPFGPPTASRARDAMSAGTPVQENHLLVEFENMPRGARVRTKRADSALDLARGYALENGS